MLVWCSGCYHFLGESPPYNDLAVRYEACGECPPNKDPQQNSLNENERHIKKMMYSLWDAGIQDDIRAGTRLIDQALSLGMRPIDISMGLLAPLLFQIGDEWEKGKISVADEHRFTAFVESLFAMLTRELRIKNDRDYKSGDLKILLFNAENNFHDVGIRLLEVWFQTSGVSARAMIPPPSTDELIELIKKHRPEIIGISVCLENHISCIQKLVKDVRAQFGSDKLQIMIGGYAVKLGAVPYIPGAILVPDIRMFNSLLKLTHPEIQI